MKKRGFFFIFVGFVWAVCSYLTAKASLDMEACGRCFIFGLLAEMSIQEVVKATRK